MKPSIDNLEQAAVAQQCRALRLPAVADVGYVPMADLGAGFLFQVIAERAEKATAIITTKLPFSAMMASFPAGRGRRNII